MDGTSSKAYDIFEVVKQIQEHGEAGRIVLLLLVDMLYQHKDYSPVVHGHIIAETNRASVWHRKCSSCLKELEWTLQPNYCPYCGAKFDGGVSVGQEK